jgi:hypothetical protein
LRRYVCLGETVFVQVIGGRALVHLNVTVGQDSDVGLVLVSEHDD